MKTLIEILKTKKFSIYEILLLLIFLFYITFTLYLFFKIIPDLIRNLEEANKDIAALNQLIIETHRNYSEKIAELEHTIQLLETKNDHRESMFLNDFDKSFKNIDWKYVIIVGGSVGIITLIFTHIYRIL